MATGKPRMSSAVVVLQDAEARDILGVLRNPKIWPHLSGQQRRRVTELIQLLESARNIDANSEMEIDENTLSDILHSMLFSIPAIYRLLASILNSGE